LDRERDFLERERDLFFSLVSDLSFWCFLDSGDFDLALSAEGFLSDLGDVDRFLGDVDRFFGELDLSFFRERLEEEEGFRGDGELLCFLVGETRERRDLEESRDRPRFGDPFSRTGECFPEEDLFGEALI